MFGMFIGLRIQTFRRLRVWGPFGWSCSVVFFHNFCFGCTSQPCSTPLHRQRQTLRRLVSSSCDREQSAKVLRAAWVASVELQFVLSCPGSFPFG